MLLISTERVSVSEQHSRAHTLLSRALREYGIEYAAGVTPVVCGEYGKPSLAGYPEVRFNLSHADGIAAVIISEYECGIDCEKIRPFDLRVMRRVLSEAEQEAVSSADVNERDLLFFRFWTLKEAYAKAIGRGLSFPLKNAEFYLEGDVISTALSGCNFTQYIINGEAVVAVCELFDNGKANSFESLDVFGILKI